jgi:resuscitation-promoting factor RpfA
MSATAAIAVLALSSTPLLAQDAGSSATQPVVTDPAPAVTATPAPTLETTPPAPDAAPESTLPDIGTPTADTPASAKRTAAPHRAATVAIKTVRHQLSKPAKAAVPAATMAAPAKPQPIVDTSAKPAKPAATTAARPQPENRKSDDTAIMAGGGALALLALGGGAFALARRRDEDDEVGDEEILHDEHVDPTPAADASAHEDVAAYEQAAMVAPAASAFAWGDVPKGDEHSDRREDETWTERAVRGPTPDNPSLSLRKRLKRAAFFEKRDREVAAGMAQPVDPDAGLPEALESEHELELA